MKNVYYVRKLFSSSPAICGVGSSACPTEFHVKTAHRVLRYLKQAPGQGILFPSKGSLQLKAFADSDWVSREDTRRSITGYLVFLGGALISWRSKKQSTVTQSTSEAEYRAMAMAMASAEIQWLHFLLQDFQASYSSTTPLFCDN